MCWPLFNPLEIWFTAGDACERYVGVFSSGARSPSDATNDWHICYFVPAAGHYFTAYF